MSEAVLRIRAEGGPEVARLLADVERLMAAGERRRRTRQDEGMRGYRESARRADEEVAESARRVTRARLRELTLQGEAQEKFRRAYEDAERRATEAVRAETGNRGALTSREAHHVETVALAMVASHERAERARTAATRREGEERRRIAAAIAAEVASTAGAAASGFHGATQGPRMEAAQISATLAGAFGEGGATAPEVGRMSDRVMAFARDEGMDPAALAQALQGAQQQFSSLSGGSASERSAALERALSQARLAGDAMSNPAEVMRLGGALGGLGSQDTINNVLRSAIGISRRGGVELGSLSQQNLATIQAQMAAAVANLRRVNPNASEADAQGAMVSAFTETLAQLEVLDPRGMQGRSAGTAIRQLGSALHDPRTAAALRTRLGNEFGANSSQVRQLFGEDGNLRAEYLNEMGGENFGRVMTQIAGGDPDRIRSLLGRGARTGDRGEVLHANQRDLLATLAGQDARGRSGWEALVGMRQGAGDVTAADLARTRAIQQSLDATNLQRAATAGMIEARKPSDARRVSDAATDWVTAHPLLAAALGPAAGFVGRGLASAARSRVLPAATNALARIGIGVGAGLGLVGGAAGGAVLLAPNTGIVGGDEEAEMLRRARARGRSAGPAAHATSAAGAAPGPVDLSANTINALAEAIARNPPVMDPATAAHAATSVSRTNTPQ